MLSIIEITLAFTLGILWGLFLETKFLIIASIFLYFLMLMFYKKYNLISVILIVVAILGCCYTKIRLKDFDTKYENELLLNINVRIISHLEESRYTYKYQCKSENGDKFIIYFKKKENTVFKIGEKLQINGEFKLPELSRNRGGFNYRRYLNSNNFYGTIMVSSFEYLEGETSVMSLIYGIQNLIHSNFQTILSKEFARNIKWNVNWRNKFYL